VRPPDEARKGTFLSRGAGAVESRAMFKRLRQLEISLAAKCQLLFGAAVVLIIAAALFVPWQRLDQLTEQINERSAKGAGGDGQGPAFIVGFEIRRGAGADPDALPAGRWGDDTAGEFRRPGGGRAAVVGTVEGAGGQAAGVRAAVNRTFRNSIRISNRTRRGSRRATAPSRCASRWRCGRRNRACDVTGIRSPPSWHRSSGRAPASRRRPPRRKRRPRLRPPRPR